MSRNKKTRRYKTFVVPVDLYRQGVMFFFGSVADFERYITKNYPDLLDKVKEFDLEHDSSIACTLQINNECIVFSTIEPPIPILTHEIIHAALIILNKVGIELSVNGEELTYLVEFISDKALKELGITSCEDGVQSR